MTRQLILLAGLLMIPLVPFLMFGDPLLNWWRAWSSAEHSELVIGTSVVCVLGTDIFLPVPSSVISTWAGGQLGVCKGTVASAAGMTLGGVIGFGLARRWGSVLVRRWVTEDLQRLGPWSAEYGPTLIVATRALPAFAEATVLLLGIHCLPWRRFLPSLITSNVVIAGAYSWFGNVAEDWLPLALLVAAVVPLAAALCVRRHLRKGMGEDV